MSIPTQGSGGTGASSSGGWDTLAADWRAQPVTAVDAEALQRQVMRRGRRLRWSLGVEALLTTVAIGMCVWATFVLEGAVFSPLASLVVIGSLLGVQGWSLWTRRRQVRDSGLDVRALLALERDRIQTSLRYWRVNTWLAVALWCVLCGLLVVVLAAPADGDVGVSSRQLIASVLVNAPVLLGFATFAWWWCRRGRQRLGRLRALQEEIDRD